MKSLLIICDLGHCPHRVPGWATELTKLGWKVFVMSPKMLNLQRKYLGIPASRNWSLLQSRHFTMVYRRYTWLSSKVQTIYQRFHSIRYKRAEKASLVVLAKDRGLSP